MKSKCFLQFSLVCGVSISPLVSCNDKPESKPEAKSGQSASAGAAKQGDKSMKIGEDGKPIGDEKSIQAMPLTPAEPINPTSPEQGQGKNQLEITDKEAALGYVRKSAVRELATVDQLTSNMGFARYMSKGSEIYVSSIGLDSMVTRFRATKMGEYLEMQWEENNKKQAAIELELENVEDAGEDLAEEEAPELEVDEDAVAVLDSENYKEFMGVAGEEVFFAAGEGSSKMLDSLMKATLEINKWQYQQTFKMMLSIIDPDLFDMGNLDQQQMLEMQVPAFLRERDGGLQILKELEIAPIYVGFKVSDKAKRDQYVASIRAVFNDMINKSDMRMMKVAESKVVKGFYGFEWSGAGFLQMMESENAGQDQDFLLQILGQDLLNDYKKELAKINAVCMVGTVDDYVVIYAGKDTESLKFEKSAGDSILNNPEVNFAKNHGGQDVASLMYFSESSMKALKSLGGTMKMYTKSFSNVLEQSEAFGDTTKFRNLLEKVGEREQELYALMPAQRVGLVAVYEDGFKLETYLGKEYPSLDLDTPRDLAKTVNHTNAAIYGSWIAGDEYSEKTKIYLESVSKAAYEGARLAAEVQHDEPGWVEFQNNFKLFDEKFADDLLRIWNSVNGGFADGVGSEFAMAMDFKGLMPRVPKVPTVILENAEIPRLTIIKPVQDRQKIELAWDEINVTSIDIAKNLEQVIGQDLKLPKPEKAEKYGLDLWSYQLGVTTKDANVAVGLSDEIWFMTTAPTGLEELMMRAYSKGSKQTAPGAELVIRMEPMRVAAQKWLALLAEHGEDMMEEQEYTEFMLNKPKIEQFLQASEDIELIDSYTRKKAGEVQSTLHFKTR